MSITSQTPGLVAAARETLRNIPNDPQDTALRALLIAYCNEVDAGAPLKDYGSKILSALSALEATPRARAAARTGNPAHDDIEAFFGAAAGE
ncbi:hypothetical protein GCM10023226_41120 [Nocardioides nanhaiensis]|uniref:Uncharacterized protein n=1 Tax=Nocardioides nanhaiensis TaxID=1476871 RepID=A0ABP8WZU0_9ACTN